GEKVTSIPGQVFSWQGWSPMAEPMGGGCSVCAILGRTAFVGGSKRIEVAAPGSEGSEADNPKRTVVVGSVQFVEVRIRKHARGDEAVLQELTAHLPFTGKRAATPPRKRHAVVPQFPEPLPLDQRRQAAPK